jgi:hypothetical protein
LANATQAAWTRASFAARRIPPASPTAAVPASAAPVRAAPIPATTGRPIARPRPASSGFAAAAFSVADAEREAVECFGECVGDLLAEGLGLAAALLQAPRIF